MRHAGRPTRSASRGIEVRGLTKSLRGHAVLRGIDLEVAPGAFCVVEGGNGAGKTTLVRVLATVVRPDGGDVFVDGWRTTSSGAEVRRSIGLVLANERSLYWRLDARENLALFARLAGLSRANGRVRTEELLERLALGDVAYERVGRLSTGQRQRVMIARALLGEPPVLLVDEPLRGLDGEGIGIVLALLAERAERGAAVLVTAPLVSELLPYASERGHLLNGMLTPAHTPALPHRIEAR